MAKYNPNQITYYATVSWQNSGDFGVSTEVFFRGPLGAPPASGTLPSMGSAGKGVSSMDISLGSTPQNGVYYAQVRHTKVGSTPSPLSPVAPVGAFGPA